jgi:hypothetical protein
MPLPPSVAPLPGTGFTLSGCFAGVAVLEVVVTYDGLRNGLRLEAFEDDVGFHRFAGVTVDGEEGD